MRLTVFVKPNAREARVEKGEGNRYIVRVAVPPVEGRANEAMLEALSEHFGAAKSRFRIVSGHRGRSKIIEFE